MRNSTTGRCCRTHRSAFTLIELLIVIAIIAIMISILVPALSRARELGHIAKCMANQRTLGQGVHGFAAEHNGYGQLMTSREKWLEVGYRPGWYAYSIWPASFLGGGQSGRQNGRRIGSAWPVAYAPYIGAPGLRTEDSFVPAETARIDPNAAVRKRQVDVLTCPSDSLLVGAVHTPIAIAGAISYNINLDIFEINNEGVPYGWNVWRRGRVSRSGLEGRLDRVFRPSEVYLFGDGGHSPYMLVSTRLIPPRHVHSRAGPMLSDYTDPRNSGNTPLGRHSKDGGLVSVFVDGHAQYLRPTAWTVDETGVRYPTRYSSEPRITPYEPYGPEAPSSSDLPTGPRGR